MADDLGEKTEDATPKRKQDSRRDGNIPRSQDFGSVFALTVGAIMVWAVAKTMMFQGKSMVGNALTADLISPMTIPEGLWPMVPYIGYRAVLIVTPLLAVVWLAGFVSQLMQVGLVLTPLKASLSKLSPAQGLKKLFSLTSAMKALLDFAKLLIVGPIVFYSMHEYAPQLVLLPYLTALQAMSMIGGFLIEMTMRVLAALLILALADFAFQRWKHAKDMRMSKQEVKDEMKSADGDPATKQRRARVQQELAMQRIGTAVPQADVIVTNPEHIAIAIKYDPERMAAPRVIAKGAELLALRIRQIAMMHGVPIVERKPLARALYRAVDVGQEVPGQFYKAIAEILAYVYRLNNRQAG